MDFEDFKNLAASIQSLMIALAVLVGGMWALFRFNKLKSIDKARADLEKVRRELHERGTLQFDMTASQITPTNGNHKYIYLSLKVKNVGNCSQIIDWTESKIAAAQVIYGDDGSIQLGKSILAERLYIGAVLDGTLLAAGNSEIFTFLIPVHETGVYLVESDLVGSPKEMTSLREEADALLGEALESIVWASNIYFNVTDEPGESPPAMDERPED